jgi:Family of unknown function (DUF5908)
MPIEIKELHIKVTVNATGSENMQAIGTPASLTAPSALSASEKEALIAECVEKILQILEAKRER